MATAAPPHESISIVRNTTTGHSKHSDITPLAKDAYKGVENDLRGCCIGPMPVEEYLKRYMPILVEHTFDVDPGFFDEISNIDRETDRYQPFVSFPSLVDCL